MKSTLFPVGSFYPAQTGGPDNTVYWITKALKKHNDNPIIVATERGIAKEVDRNKWINTNYGKVIYTKNLIHYFPLKLIWTALKETRNSDVIHLAMIFYPASFIIAFINHFFIGKPVIWSVHGDLDPYMLRRSAWKKQPVKFFINAFLKKHVLFHVTCDAEADYVADNFGKEAETIQVPNFMEFPELLDLEKENYLLYIGRIDPKKAIENLITALHKSKPFMESDFVLKIAGNHNNPYGQKLANQIVELGLENRIEFLGHVAGKEKQELLARAYFQIMPSHTENHGIVVMEAMIQGTPAVASTGTPWEVLETEKAGFWVDNDPQTLTNTLENIFGLSEEEYKGYCKRARKVANEEFNIYEKINVWRDAYEQVSKK